jgi:hypothetical protein
MIGKPGTGKPGTGKPETDGGVHLECPLQVRAGNTGDRRDVPQFP